MALACANSVHESRQRRIPQAALKVRAHRTPVVCDRASELLRMESLRPVCCFQVSSRTRSFCALTVPSLTFTVNTRLTRTGPFGMKNKKIKRVLVAVKPFERGLPLAVSRARLLAEHLDADIDLVACVSDVGLETGFGLGLGSDLASAEPATLEVLRAGWHKRALEALDELAEPLRATGARVTTHVSSHRPVYEGLLEVVASVRADLLVVGVHEPTPLPHTRLTDTDWQLMRLCPRPLLLARDPSLDRYGTLLAAVDPLRRHAEPPGLDEAVLRTAHELAAGFGADLCVANVYPNPEEYEVASSVEVEPGVFYGTENFETAYRRALDELIDGSGIEPTATILRRGRPAAMLIEVAREREVDLIVLGALKRNMVEAAVLGSTAERVVAEASSDVLLVK